MSKQEEIQPEKFKLTNYKIERILGTGSFGRVKLAKQKFSNKLYAMKILEKRQIIKLKQVDHLQNEIKILSLISHPFIVSTSGYAQDDTYIYILLELITGGELFTFLREQVKFFEDEAMFYAGQVVLIFEYLHSKNIIYRDLKPENLLIDNFGYLKLTDFGFAKICLGRTYTLCGTPEYIAPEILLNKGHGKAVDWWTFGILLYEMLVGIDPFNDEDPMKIYQKILKGKIKFPSNFSKSAKSLIKHLLVADLSKRYGNMKNGVDDIKNHRFFKDLDWKLLIERKLKGPYIPKIKNFGDDGNFSEISESNGKAKAKPIPLENDPFVFW